MRAQRSLLRLSVWLLPLLSCLVSAQDLGIKARKPIFGGACKVCPWGAMGDIVKAAMQPYGYDVQVCYNCSGADAPRIVAGAKLPPPIEELWQRAPYLRNQAPAPPHAPVEFGATGAQFLWDAYQGTGAYAREAPHKNLRLIANIQSPTYLIVAAKAELGITDLRQIKEKRWPVRVLTSVGNQAMDVLAYYGLTKESIESAGGHVGSGMAEVERKNFDVAIGEGTLANAPEFNMWYEITQKFDLTYLQLPEELLRKLAQSGEMDRASIPDGLLRGIDHPIPSVAHTGVAIYGRTDTPDDFAYAVAKAMDEHQDLLQWSLLNFSYNLHNVWKAYDVPLHPGAARYYRQIGYMK
jgi:uncharacterized protein